MAKFSFFVRLDFYKKKLKIEGKRNDITSYVSVDATAIIGTPNMCLSDRQQKATGITFPRHGAREDTRWFVGLAERQG